MAKFIMAQYKDNLLGEANSFLEVLEQVSRLAPLDKPVLVIGERGTGKELIANRLHYLSARWQGPFISLNCAALNDNLLDSELFGHEAGAFTGASKRHPGRFERADGGTLFLDELATAPMLVQEKLLRVIEYGELERVGGSQPLQVNVRLVCATNADLPRMVEEGHFRADLLDRLAFDVVQLPPLRERQSDIMLLANQFAIQMCRELGLPLFPGFSERATATLLGYRWPGNIRELKNVVERSVYRHGDSEHELDAIILNPFLQTAASVPEAASGDELPALPLDLRDFQLQQEKRLLQRSLQQAKYHQKQAAELLGLTYHQLRALLKKHQL
ncbi:phage shock protein operon transcriptional activator [Klebsiella quasipneumoniae]